MTDIGTVKKHRKADSLSVIEGRLLKATHDLAATLGVEPQQAIRALSLPRSTSQTGFTMPSI